MSELRRWLDDAPPSEVRRLLEVGQWARPSRAVFEQALSQVQAAGTIDAADDLPPTRHGNRGRAAIKWTLIGALLVGSLAALNSTLESGQSASGPLPPMQPPLSEPAPRAPSVLGAPQPVTAPEPTQAEPAPSPAAHRSAVAPTPPRSSPAHSPRAVAPSASRARVCKPGVVEQIEMLEQAKNKVAQGRGAEALAILQRYDGFGAGRCFVPESLKHRMDAYVQMGNRAAARRMATAIKTSYPDTAQARAAEAVLKQ